MLYETHTEVSMLQIKTFKSHNDEVNYLSFDDKSEYLGSSSDDKTVVVYSLYTDDILSYKMESSITVCSARKS